MDGVQSGCGGIGAVVIVLVVGVLLLGLALAGTSISANIADIFNQRAATERERQTGETQREQIAQQASIEKQQNFYATLTALTTIATSNDGQLFLGILIGGVVYHLWQKSTKRA